VEKVARFVVVRDTSRRTFDAFKFIEDQMADQGLFACSVV